MHSWLVIRAILEAGPVRKALASVMIIAAAMGVSVHLAPYVGGHRPSLPFNFVMWFGAGVFFTVAYAIYLWRCPALVKEAHTYGAIANGPHSEHDLRVWYHKAVVEEFGRVDAKSIQSYLSLVRGNDNLSEDEFREILTRVAGHALLDPYWNTPAGPVRLPIVYDHARSFAARSLIRWRIVTLLFICVGLAFLAAAATSSARSALAYLTFDDATPAQLISKNSPEDKYYFFVHENFGSAHDVAFEFRPKTGTTSFWQIAFPTGLKPIKYGSGKSNGGPISDVTFDFREGTGLTFEGIAMDFVGCSNPIGEGQSAYIVFSRDSVPRALHFGEAGKAGIAQTGVLFRFGPRE